MPQKGSLRVKGDPEGQAEREFSWGDAGEKVDPAAQGTATEKWSCTV